ncbi:MAG: undecaprenyl-diphosphatase [Rubritalea sp.]|jgi:undecaprenyl-diphosphatase
MWLDFALIMTIWQAIIVGIVQGLAEFLPISSSGHIVLTQMLLGIEENSLSFEIVLHLGTLLSVLIYFRASLWKLCQSLWTREMKEERMMIVWLGVATVPAVIAYKLFSDSFKAAYENPVLVSGLLLMTAALLFVPKIVKNKTSNVGAKSSLWMGLAQAFAILPGISRSGSTIAAGLVSGVKAEKAAEFSFLMSIPAIAGGFVLNLKEEAELQGSWANALESCTSDAYIWGAVASAVVGLLAISLAMKVVKQGKLEYFSYYLITVSIAGMIYFTVNPV